MSESPYTMNDLLRDVRSLPQEYQAQWEWPVHFLDRLGRECGVDAVKHFLARNVGEDGNIQAYWRQEGGKQRLNMAFNKQEVRIALETMPEQMRREYASGDKRYDRRRFLYSMVGGAGVITNAFAAGRHESIREEREHAIAYFLRRRKQSRETVTRENTLPFTQALNQLDAQRRQCELASVAGFSVAMASVGLWSDSAIKQLLNKERFLIELGHQLNAALDHVCYQANARSAPEAREGIA